MISKWNHSFFTVSSCQWYTVWYSLIQTTIYTWMMPVFQWKKNQNILYNLLIKSINEIKKTTLFLKWQSHKDFLILISEMCVNKNLLLIANLPNLNGDYLLLGSTRQ